MLFAQLFYLAIIVFWRHSHMVWHAQVFCLSEPSNMLRAVFKKRFTSFTANGMNLSQYPGIWFLILPLEFAINFSFFITKITITQCLEDHRAPASRLLALLPRPTTEHSIASIQFGSLHVSHDMGLNSVLIAYCVVSRSKRSLPSASFSGVMQDTAICHLFGRNILAYPFYWIPTYQNFIEYIFQDLEHMCQQDLWHTSHLLLVLTKWHDVINVMNQYNVLRDAKMVQLFWDYVITEGRRVK